MYILIFLFSFFFFSSHLGLNFSHPLGSPFTNFVISFAILIFYCIGVVSVYVTCYTPEVIFAVSCLTTAILSGPADVLFWLLFDF